MDDPDTTDTGMGEPPLADMGAHEFQTCPDLDGDASVGFGDLLAVLTAWGPDAPACLPSIPADLDHDCAVGFSDLLVVLTAWGRCE